MNIYKMSFIFGLVFLALACKHSENSNDQNGVPIALNNGQKWAVNIEMAPNILDAEQLILQYDGADYKTLADQLQIKNKDLIKSCTMSGKSHDELHKWLHPHMELIELLNDVDSKVEADRIIAQLKSSFQTYHAYFQ